MRQPERGGRGPLLTTAFVRQESDAGSDTDSESGHGLRHKRGLGHKHGHGHALGTISDSDTDGPLTAAGGRIYPEKLHPDARWNILDVAVIAV